MAAEWRQIRDLEYEMNAAGAVRCTTYNRLVYPIGDWYTELSLVFTHEVPGLDDNGNVTTRYQVGVALIPRWHVWAEVWPELVDDSGAVMVE